MNPCFLVSLFIYIDIYTTLVPSEGPPTEEGPPAVPWGASGMA